MNDKLQKLLDEYRNHYAEFTYAHYLDPKHAYALRVGLVGCYYINQAYLPEKRAAIGKVLALYNNYWGDKLQAGFLDGNPNQLARYDETTIEQKLEAIDEFANDTLNFYWSSVDNMEFVPNYLIKTFSSAGWYEELHKSISYVQLYLPIEELETFGVDRLIEFNREVAEILQPMHGFFGLGILHSNQYFDYQYLECEIAQQFLGLDVSNIEFDFRFRNGFKSINWLMILGSELLNAKLGGLNHLEQQNHDKAISIYPYNGGVLVRAGDLPELANIETNPYPLHYVNANTLLNAARAPEIGSLGFGSINGEIRFNNRTTKEWQQRFDNVKPTDSSTDNPIVAPEEGADKRDGHNLSHKGEEDDK